jgi:hypothetical protein
MLLLLYKPPPLLLLVACCEGKRSKCTPFVALDRAATAYDATSGATASESIPIASAAIASERRSSNAPETITARPYHTWPNRGQRPAFRSSLRGDARRDRRLEENKMAESIASTTVEMPSSSSHIATTPTRKTAKLTCAASSSVPGAFLARATPVGRISCWWCLVRRGQTSSRMPLPPSGSPCPYFPGT